MSLIVKLVVRYGFSRNWVIDHELNYWLQRVQGDMVQFQTANKNNSSHAWDAMVDDDTPQLEEGEVTRDFTSTEQSSPYGEIAPAKHDVSKILGEDPATIGNARYWLIRGTFDSVKDARIYKQIEKAVRHLKVRDSDRYQLQERIKKKLPKTQNETGLAMKKAIAGLLYSETRELGVPVDELQRCLANSGIDLRTKKLRFVTRRSEGCEQHPPSSSSLVDHILLNGQKPRDKPVVEQIACGYYEVSLVPMLDEVLGGGGDVKIAVGCDCAICSFDGADISRDGKSAVMRASTKKSCFAAFRMANRTLPADLQPLEDEKGRQERMEKKILAIYSPFSDNHPLTRALAIRTCCLAQLQSEFLRCYRELTENGTAGTSPRSLARKAVFAADARVYAHLSRERKLAAWELLMPSLSHLSAEDRRYALVSGICIPSEFA